MYKSWMYLISIKRYWTLICIILEEHWGVWKISFSLYVIKMKEKPMNNMNYHKYWTSEATLGTDKVMK